MPSHSHKPPTLTPHLKATRVSQAGLVRNRRGRPAARLGPTRFDFVEPEDLAYPVSVPHRAANGVEWLPVPGWDLPWLWAGFSTRKGGLSRVYGPEDTQGELNLGLTADDDRKIVACNRQLLAEAVTGDRKTPLVPLRQFHSNLIVQATRSDAARKVPRRADGQITDVPGLLLAVQTADCVPILVADRRVHAVGAFHAGWRGTVRRIVESGIGRMRLAFGSRPEDLVAAIGPGIGPCCYAVGDEVFSAFDSQFAYAGELFHEVADTDAVRKKYPMLFLTQRAPGHSSIGPSLHVNLIEANRRQLLAAGLKPESIQVIGGCTQCHAELFFSHRASHGHAGRMMAVIGIRAAKARKKPE
jgi:polyphenol oxidase